MLPDDKDGCGVTAIGTVAFGTKVAQQEPLSPVGLRRNRTEILAGELMARKSWHFADVLLFQIRQKIAHLLSISTALLLRSRTGTCMNRFEEGPSTDHPTARFSGGVARDLPSKVSGMRKLQKHDQLMKYMLLVGITLIEQHCVLVGLVCLAQNTNCMHHSTSNP